jgi:DNA-binding XRE family transcriptional regulator
MEIIELNGKEVLKIKTTDIVYRQDLYPRFEPNQSQIQKYSDSIEFLPPIKLNQNNILIDGFHRWKAFMLAGHTEIPYEVVETESEKQLKKLAYQLNSNHGLQLSIEEKKAYAQEMFGEQMSVQELSVVLGVTERVIQKWTVGQAEAMKETRNRKICDLYLKAHNTQEQIANITGVPKQTINDIIEKSEKRICSEFGQTFTPLLYNIWNTPKQDNERKHFGAFPEVFMENLLHYHTEPLDIIYDPFGGGGTTVDVCKRMFRRYYVTDRKVIPGRENDIVEHDIQRGLPEIPKPKMVFLDPPYWLQAENQYSEDKDDLGNMSLEDFNASMKSLLVEIKKRKVELIACVIQPTQYKNNWKWTDHIIDFHEMVNDKYEIQMRYVLPYSTEQYLPQMVIKAKEKNKCLSTFRDLIVWRMK